MSCGITIRRLPRRSRASQIDAEVADILRRVFGAEPISYGSELWVPSGPVEAVERLRASVAEIQRQPGTGVPALAAARSTTGPLSEDWLAAFIQQHTEKAPHISGH